MFNLGFKVDIFRSIFGWIQLRLVATTMDLCICIPSRYSTCIPQENPLPVPICPSALERALLTLAPTHGPATNEAFARPMACAISKAPPESGLPLHRGIMVHAMYKGDGFYTAVAQPCITERTGKPPTPMETSLYP